MKKNLAYLKLIRVKHWIKNFLIFFPLIFGGFLFNQPYLLNGLYAFLIFSLTSSFVYVVNDIRDVDKDRKHSTKRNRPIASGTISIKSAGILSIIIGLIVLGVSIIFGIVLSNLFIVLIPIIYITINLLYSIGLKNYPIIDVMCIVAGFMLRLLYGSIFTNINISNWLYLTVMFFSFYLAFGKRRNEILQEGDKARVSLSKYNESFLDKNMYMCLTLGIVFYSLWCMYGSAAGNNMLIWSVPFLLLIFFLYSLDIEKGSNGDPTEVILSNKVLLGAGLLFGISVFTLLYLL